ncbi:glycoside hydrolase family 78 protein [Cohnella silvisoli]|uniref:alpha-L-rhamnosidase n=1 Tax=Cohnella silvisoli TaxID=2873699 RepID=A0ABV1KL12_9BACL|nr:glycoside hydrolase family 78 protein [Cohnella silvisoli]MCD9020827.1 glycoside hydrolase family 78 protein [Cohnella silvisoli]
MLEVIELRCEYKNNPVGIDVINPRISWKLKSDQRSIKQSVYEIEVADDQSFENGVWNSGKVISDQSVHVELDGLNVVSRKRYHYRVKGWNQNGDSSGWSEPAYWETGILDKKEWQAQWIGTAQNSESEQCPLLRKGFEVTGGIKQARIYASALGLYELELNGTRVGDSYFTPGWTSYKHRLQVQTYDVTEQLIRGENVIGATLGNGWYKGYLTWGDRRNLYGDRQALFAQLHLIYEDGREEIIITDGSWKTAGSPVLMSEIYHGETYDARLELPAWSCAGFDDSGWQAVEAVSQSNDVLIAQENDPVKKIEEIKPIELIKTPKGETVIDLGQNMVGWLRFTVQGVAGSEVEIHHAEVLDQEGNFYTDNIRSAKQTIRYILKGGDKETYEPRFTFQGFRYVRLVGFGEAVRLEDFTGIVLHTDMASTGEFECSDPLVNQLQHNIEWGLKGNFLDVPTDCPQRDERLGWTGDAQMFIRTAAYLKNIAPFFTKWSRDLAADQTENGGVPFVIPQVLSDKDHSSAAWGDAAVICPWTIYLCYGDKRILEEQYDSMQAWVGYIRSQGDNEYLWNTGFHFGDWLGLDSKPDTYIGATDRDYIATAFYAYSTSLLQKSAAVLGKTEDALNYGELYERIVEAFTEEFVTPSGRLSVPTQTAQVLGLMFGLLEGKAKKRANDKLMELLEESKFHLTTGFVGTPYLNHVLSDNGHLDAAYKLLFQQDYPSWLYQVTKGATTIWEHWDGIKEDGSFWSKDMNSFNHYAYGAIGDWLYRSVAGIDTDEQAAGYKRIFIRPQPGEGLTWAEGRLDTMYGKIRSSWKKTEQGGMELEVSIPPNTTAEIQLPGAGSDSVKESGIALNKATGVDSTEQTDKGVVLTVGSGDYKFSW